MAGLSSKLPGLRGSRPPRLSAPAAAMLLFATACLAAEGDGFPRLPEPRSGEWRAIFPEAPQDLAQYRDVAGGAPLTADGGAVALVPVGDERPGERELLLVVRDYLRDYFQRPVELLPRVGIPRRVPRRASSGFGTQYEAEGILAELGRVRLPRVPAISWRLGITGEDLFGRSPGGGTLRFVFGMAGAAGVGVVSSARFASHYPGEPAGITPGRRLAKVAAHELGHCMALAHCQIYACGMNGSNAIAEADRRPAYLCPECREKLGWYLGWNQAARYRALAGRYTDMGWPEESAHARRQAGLFTAPPADGPEASR